MLLVKSLSLFAAFLLGQQIGTMYRLPPAISCSDLTLALTLKQQQLIQQQLQLQELKQQQEQQARLRATERRRQELRLKQLHEGREGGGNEEEEEGIVFAEDGEEQEIAVACPKGQVPSTDADFYEKMDIIEEIGFETCQPSVAPSVLSNSTFIHKFSYSDAPSVLNSVFKYLHHPSCPSQGEVVLSQEAHFLPDFSTCTSVYAMRSGARVDQPTKCLAVIRAPEGGGHYSPTAISHRTGHIDWPQVLTDQYQDDIVHFYSFDEERNLTTLFLNHRDEVVRLFLELMGPPIDENGNRRTAIIMVANEGVMDLVLNFMCSGDAAGIDLSSFVIFLGQDEYSDLVKSFGAKSFYHYALGLMPSKHSESYADRAFSRIMWLKVTSVYIALTAGFNVVFQDADLVWIKDPIPYLESLHNYDMIFMDDGARTPRFSPFFTNTGFYFTRNTPKTMFLQERLIRSLGEISYTASHQATLIRHLTETHYAYYLQILILDDNDFPSGQMYHHQPEYVDRVKRFIKIPYVWHMCWTANRQQKVTLTCVIYIY